MLEALCAASARLAAGVPTGWFLVCLGLALPQLYAVLRFQLGLRRREPQPAAWPSASVIVPCKGAGPDLEGNIRALLGQDYPGSVEFIFAVPGGDDPAGPVLRRVVCERPERRAAVVACAEAPRVCGGKVLGLLAGARAAGGDILLFADSDLRVRPDWCRRLVAGLGDPRVAAAFSAMLYLPGGRGLAGWLRLAWTGWGIPWLEPLTSLAGQSMAVFRKDFESLGVARAWASSVSDDLTLARLCRAAGRRTRFVGGAMPVGSWSGSLRQTLGLFNRWTAILRVYDRRIWLAGLVLTALKWSAAARAAQSWSALPLLAFMLGADMLCLGWFCAAAARNVPGLFDQAPPLLRRAPFLAGLAAPLLWPAHAVNFAYSLIAPAIAWSGWSYELQGPDRVAAAAGEAAATEAFADSSRRLAAAALSGAVLGWAYWPGRNGLAAWAAFVPLLWAVAREPGARGAFRKGWLFGAAGTMAR
ncbi:MAG: glycosyltransferase, partial [Elusimicrobia bacterium]|nr:glycosyltransferase [Elusimicrobiota bacterium]